MKTSYILSLLLGLFSIGTYYPLMYRFENIEQGYGDVATLTMYKNVHIVLSTLLLLMFVFIIKIPKPVKVSLFFVLANVIHHGKMHAEANMFPIELVLMILTLIPLGYMQMKSKSSALPRSASSLATLR